MRHKAIYGSFIVIYLTIPSFFLSGDKNGMQGERNHQNIE
jgi:hypothetical protein